MYGLAYLDVTTGEFAAAEVSDADLGVELARLRPAEVLVPEGSGLAIDAPLTPEDPRCFRPDEASRVLREHFGVASLEGFGLRSAPLATAAPVKMRRREIVRRGERVICITCSSFGLLSLDGTLGEAEPPPSAG